MNNVMVLDILLWKGNKIMCVKLTLVRTLQIGLWQYIRQKRLGNTAIYHTRPYHTILHHTIPISYCMFTMYPIQRTLGHATLYFIVTPLPFSTTVHTLPYHIEEIQNSRSENSPEIFLENTQTHTHKHIHTYILLFFILFSYFLIWRFFI